MNAPTRDFIAYVHPLGPMGSVIYETAKHFGLKYADVVGPRRWQKLVKPRRLAMAACRNFTGATLPEIGHAFHRDHTTILYAVRKFDETATPEERAAAETIARRAGVLKEES